MRKRFLAIALLLLCLVLPMPAWADASELLPEDALLNGQGIPADWFGEAWFEDSEDHQIEMDEAEGAVCIRNFTENDARLCYTIKVKSNTYYALCCDIKTENVEGGQGANVSVRDCLAASEPLFGTQDWQRVSLTGKTGKKQKEMTICVRVGGYAALSSGTAWFKNVSLIETEKTADAQDFSPAQANEAEESAKGEGKTLFGPVLLITLLCGVLMLLFKRFVIERKEQQMGERKDAAPLIVVLMAALLLRILLSKIVYGYPVDINCFMAWGNALAQDGFGAFYTGGMFADYPPGYMYVLGLMSKLAQAFGVAYASDVYALLIKLPAILCDVVSAYVVYRMAQARFSERTALWLCALMAFNPVMVFLSGGWGQIDCVLTLLFVCALWLFLSEKRIAAGAVYGLAILVKPQALMLGPLLAAAYFLQIKNKRDALRTAAAVCSAFAVILLLAWPFKSTQETGWLLQRYFNTATSYPYASVEAFNLMALLGGNWTDVDKTLLFFSYKTLGTLLIAASVLFACALYVRAHKRQGALWLCSAYLLCSVFTLGHYMHERYLFPVLLLLLIAFIETKDKRLYTLFALFSLSLLLNSLCAFCVSDGGLQRGLEYDVLTYIGSVLNVGGWAYFSYAIYQSLIKEKPLAAFTEEAPIDEDFALKAWRQETDTRPLFTKKDRLLCGALTLCYAVVALVNLGSLQAPENAWKASAGETATIRLEAPAQIGEIWVFGGIAEGEASIMLDDGQSFPYEQSFDNMFRWQPLQLGGTTKTLTIRVNRGELWINELAIKGAQGELLFGSADIAALLDEQESVPEAPSHLNGMYFDELYHGRTAYEHLHGLEPYENSHPPLGKVLIMAGVALFGMNAFGWRIVGCLLGIAMLPILYAFAKRLFKKTEYAFFAAALFACDFMHFTQTRIATIDVYAVFFILLMYDFMYQYICMDFLKEGVKKTLRPLALSGLFFGLGAASKWTCIYAGGGLAVVLLLSLLRRYRESRMLLASSDTKLQAAGARCGKDTIKTLLWCCLFFVAVPIAIYLLSYLPYVLSEKHYDLEGIWGVQEFMFSYHSGLTATHPYQSAWWQWPLDLRPMWYYVGYTPSGTKAGTISAFGNPAVWWVCSAALLALIWYLISGKLKTNRETDVLVVGAAANYLPWVLVPRCTFIYHYFPMVPFIILAAVYLLKEAEQKYPQLRRGKWVWLGVCALLFLLFYPVCSGLTVPTTYIRALEWLPGWTFLGY